MVKVRCGEAWEWSGGRGCWSVRGVAVRFDAFMSHLPARYQVHATVGMAMPQIRVPMVCSHAITSELLLSMSQDPFDVDRMWLRI
jgi:hypothetical protein